MSTSGFTKYMIAQGMKTLLETKSFEDISVGDLARECRISRNTFYYHFKDKYDIINWIFYSEITPIIREASIENWSEGLLRLCRYMQQNKSFYIKVLHVQGQNSFIEGLMEFYMNMVQNLLLNVKADKILSQEQIRVISHFYAFGLAGVLMDWAKDGMESDPQPVVDMLREMFSGEIFDKILALQGKTSQKKELPLCSADEPIRKASIE